MSKKRWCVTTGFSSPGKIYVYADRVYSDESGNLVCLKNNPDKGNHSVSLMLSCGNWASVYEVDEITGEALSELKIIAN